MSVSRFEKKQNLGYLKKDSLEVRTNKNEYVLSPRPNKRGKKRERERERERGRERERDCFELKTKNIVLSSRPEC